MRLVLTRLEGKWLFVAAANYGRAQSCSENDTLWAEKLAKEQDVLALFRRLKTFCVKNEKGYCFGPENEEAWSTPVFNLHDNERDGLYWVLLAALDPRSPAKAGIIETDDLLWPLAEKIRRVKAIRKELKLDEVKRVKIEDDAPALEEVEEIETPEKIANS